ncbi:Protein MAK B [Ananas comosus]|uniref:Protein MAK B n=1 Tax=Ananas comosus TaxID=4615 RepID=A0A199UYQ7_ANACO|nr:Protein MAK B [Ananas comosus]
MLPEFVIGARALSPIAATRRFAITKEYWPKLLVHKIKQRLTKMTQYRIRMRKLQLKNIQKELVERLKKGVYPGEIVNIPEKLYNEVVEMEGLKPSPEEEEAEEEEDPEVEYVEGYDELEEEEDMEDFGGFPTDELLKDDEYIDMDEESEQNSGSDRKIAKKRRKGAGSDAETLDGSDYSAKLKRKGKVIIEVEGNDVMADRRRAEM